MAILSIKVVLVSVAKKRIQSRGSFQKIKQKSSLEFTVEAKIYNVQKAGFKHEFRLLLVAAAVVVVVVAAAV